MSEIPDCISPRDLFWLWYDRATLAQKVNAAEEFDRFVRSAEIIVQLQMPKQNYPHDDAALA